MKLGVSFRAQNSVMSHPAWGEWIEILAAWALSRPAFSLTPHGVSGLKLPFCLFIAKTSESHPAWGEWIEISTDSCPDASAALSHPAWGEWIEICSKC